MLFAYFRLPRGGPCPPFLALQRTAVVGQNFVLEVFFEYSVVLVLSTIINLSPAIYRPHKLKFSKIASFWGQKKSKNGCAKFVFSLPIVLLREPSCLGTRFTADKLGKLFVLAFSP